MTEAQSSATAFIEEFFKAFDRRDLQTIEAAFVPSASIVHDDGVATDIPSFLAILRGTREWLPRTRRLWNYDVQMVDEVAIVGCLNEVSFQGSNGENERSTYNETWVLARGPDGLKACRVHYSRVRADQHSEDIP